MIQAMCASSQSALDLGLRALHEVSHVDHGNQLVLVTWYRVFVELYIRPRRLELALASRG